MDIKDRARAAVEAEAQFQAAGEQRVREYKQKRQERDARNESKRRRKHERQALRFFRKRFGTHATVLEWRTLREPWNGIPGERFLFAAGRQQASESELVLAVPGLPFAAMYVAWDNYQGFLPYCTDCGTVLAQMSRPPGRNDEAIYIEITNLVQLGRYLSAFKDHACDQAADSQTSRRTAQTN